MTQEEKIKDLEQRDNSALLEELRKCKKAASGYKGKNVQFQNELKNLKQQMENLKARIEHYKNLDLEGDRLYEEKIAECEALRKDLEGAHAPKDNSLTLKITKLQVELDNKENYIELQNQRIQELVIKNRDYESKMVAQKQYIEELEDEIAECSKPWWKKIF